MQTTNIGELDDTQRQALLDIPRSGLNDMLHAAYDDEEKYIDIYYDVEAGKLSRTSGILLIEDVALYNLDIGVRNYLEDVIETRKGYAYQGYAYQLTVVRMLQSMLETKSGLYYVILRGQQKIAVKRTEDEINAELDALENISNLYTDSGLLDAIS